MRWQGFYTLCIFYTLLCYTVAQSSAVPATTTSPTSLTNLVSSTGTVALVSTVSHLDISTDKESSSHTTSRGTKVSQITSRTSIFSTHGPASSASSSPPGHSPQHHHLQASAIVGIVFGTLAGLVLILSVGRCWWSWRKTPSRDRIESLLHRYDLEREMENALVQPLRARVRRPPPPPYRPPPPGYDSVLRPSSPRDSEPSPSEREHR